MLATCVVLALVFWQWRPLPQVIWSVDGAGARAAMLGVSLAGFGLVLYASFLIDHFDLFGLRQVWRHLHGLPHQHPTFKMPWLYRQVRNPLMLGFLIAFWVTPDLTLGRLLFNVAITGYILVGVALEERDLAASLGEEYGAYRQRTPMLLPRCRSPAPRRQSGPAWGAGPKGQAAQDRFSGESDGMTGGAGAGREIGDCPNSVRPGNCLGVQSDARRDE